MWRGRDAVHVVLLAGALAVAAFLRFDGLGEPSYWLDEILHQKLTSDAASQPLWRWIIGFSPEHGPLYYATQLTARAFGTSEAAGRFPAALLGLLTIPLVWLAMKKGSALRADPPSPAERERVAVSEANCGVRAAAAAILLAVSPLHVYYSREARAYALLMFLAAALIAVLLRARSIAAAGAVLLALLYASATGAPIVAAGFLVSCAAVLLAPARETRRWYAAVASISFVVLVLFRFVYASKPAENALWPPFPPLDAKFFGTLIRTFSVTALGTHIGGRAAVAMLLFAAIGAFAAVKRDRVAGVVLAGMALLPLAIALGTLRLLNHFYAERYVAPAIVGYVILAGCGIAAVAEMLGRRAALPIGVVIAVTLAAQGWTSARTEPFQKLDWRAIAATLWRYAHREDVIVAVEPWSEVSLRYYLNRLPKRATLEGVPYAPVAEALIGMHPATWLVSAGFSDTPARAWMCRYPLVLASPLESFRMHYASATSDFLRERGGPAEQRALAAALGPHVLIDLAAAQNSFLDSGWANPEGFRWATGTRASVTFPRWGLRERVIRMRVEPMDNPALPPQTVRASLNGRLFGELTLAPGWTERSLLAPATFWKNGMNTLAFEFGRAAVPADLDPRATDRRPLAVAFEWIVIDDFAGAATQHAYSARIASGPFIDEKTAWRRTNTLFPASTLRRDGVEALLGRLGIDPLTTWPRLARGELHLDDLVETVAYGSDCEDDHAFLQRAFRVLLERGADPAEERELRKLTRVSAVGRMIKSDEFRRQVTSPSSGRRP